MLAALGRLTGRQTPGAQVDGAAFVRPLQKPLFDL